MKPVTVFSPVPFARPIVPWLWFLARIFSAAAAETNDVASLDEAALLRGPATTAVLYNSSMPESVSVAHHYAERRGVPEPQLIGLPLSGAEGISREEFETRLLKPFVAEMSARGFWKLRDEILPASETQAGQVIQVPAEVRIRNLVVCYGVPLRVAEDPTRRPAESARTPSPLRKNEAAVDAELTVLPLLLGGQSIHGPLNNPWFGATNGLAINPLGGVFVVGRLDGPTPELAKRLVDLALEGEKNGLLGRGYFDMRGLSNSSYLPGDRWISNAWLAVKGYGYETHLDRRPEVLPAGFPISHLAFYAGWYEQSVTGAFARPETEFMPGAVAYHLHSFSAATIRSTNSHWVGPLIALGATATMGTVAEPYLDGTPEIGLCFARLMYSGMTWGEAALVSQKLLSWQLTVIGDPLYRPFAMNALARARDLALRGQGLRADWAAVTLYNRRRDATGDLREAIADLEKEPRLRFSSVLQEKLAEFHEDAGAHEQAAKRFLSASNWQPSPQQKKRLLWSAGRNFLAAKLNRDAYSAWRRLAEEPLPTENPTAFFEQLLQLARQLDEDKDARRWTEELARLRSPVATALP